MICVVSCDKFWVLHSKLPSSTYIEKGGCLSTWLSLLQPIFYCHLFLHRLEAKNPFPWQRTSQIYSNTSS